MEDNREYAGAAEHAVKGNPGNVESVRACVVCWNQSRAVTVEVTEASECKRCRQPFKVVQLERDHGSTGPWRKGLEIRTRPPGNRDHDFELCAFFRKGRCSAGMRCSFAHSEEERTAWNQEQAADNWRQVRPRPRGIQGRFSLCKTQISGTCVYGDKCTFAHSQLERRVWNSGQPIPNPTSPAAAGGAGVEGGSGRPSGGSGAWGGGAKTDSAPSTPSSGGSYNSRGERGDGLSAGGVASGWASSPQVAERKDAPPPPPHQLRGPLGNIFSAARHLHAQRPKACAAAAADFRDSPGGTSAWRKGAGTPLSVKDSKPQQRQSEKASRAAGAAGQAAGGPSHSAWGGSPASATVPNPRLAAVSRAAAAAASAAAAAAAAESPAPVRKVTSNPLLKMLEDGGPEAKELLRDKGGIEISEAANGKLDVLVPCDGPDDDPSPSMSSAWAEGGGEVPLGGRVRAAWVFRVKNCNPRLAQTLVSVCTLDISEPDFRLVMEGEPAASNDRLADERLLRSSIEPGQFVDVTLQMRSHELAVSAYPKVQWVIFKFNGFVCARRVSVRAVEEEDLLAASLRCRDASAAAAADDDDPFPAFQEDLIDREEDIFWDCARDIEPFDRGDGPLGDAGGGEDDVGYVLPPDVACRIEDGRLAMLSSSLAVERSNYRRRMHNLVFVEEFERRKAISRYNLLCVDPLPMASWQCRDGSVLYPAPGEVFVKLDLEEEVLEQDVAGTFAIRRGDRALLRPLTLTHSEHDGPDGERSVYQGIVVLVGRGYVVLRIKAEVIARLQRDADTADTCDVRFTVDRSSYEAMHRAIDAVDLGWVFPDLVARPSAWQLQEPVQERLLGDARLDPAQTAIVSQMVAGGSAAAGSAGAPLLVSGPFGTGKSRVIEEAVLQIVQCLPGARVLLCTAHEATADGYLVRLAALLEPFHESTACKSRLIRVPSAARPEADIPEAVLRHCVTSVSSLGTHLRRVQATDVEACNVIVSTMLGAEALAFVRCAVGPECFTHIICDEAAQVPADRAHLFRSHAMSCHSV